MLVLSATYMSDLRPLVRRDTLEYLLRRTIKFLAMYKDISPTLMADAQILSGIYYKIFKKPVNTSFTTESFSSTWFDLNSRVRTLFSTSETST